MYGKKDLARHPDDVYWDNVQRSLDDLADLVPGTSSGPLIDIASAHGTPTPPPRTRFRPEVSPIPRPRTLRNSPLDGFELIDYSEDATENAGCLSPDSHLIALLETSTTGYEFDPTGDCRKITLERGTLLKPLMMPDSQMAQRLRDLGPRSNQLLFTDLLRRNVGTFVRGAHIMRLTEDQTLLLLPANLEERLELHKDLDRFHFVENIKSGDWVSVVAENNSSMYQGRVVWMGERPREVGTWFNVEINRPTNSMNVPDWGGPPPPRTLYANAAHIQKPLRNIYDYRDKPPPVYQSEVRNIPIKRVETQFNADNTTTQTVRMDDPSNIATATAVASADAFARDINTWDGDPRSVESPLREWNNKPTGRMATEERRNGTARGRTMSNGISQPSRSQSAHTVAVYDKTVSVDDVTKSNGAVVGDRCVWYDGHHHYKGTIRFIGHLKGHTSLYAGIEFDHAVGKGTGVFQGEQVFQTAENRAGFVVLNTVELLPRPQQNGEKPLAVRHKQASAESLSDPAAPSAPPLPPAVPPRPVMNAEDYLIDSFSIGSCVEVCHIGACRSGVVRWLGDYISEDQDHLEKSATIELDTDIPHGWRYAPPQCNPGGYPKTVLVPTTTLRRDRRVHEAPDAYIDYRSNGKADFGSIDSGIETTPCEPWKMTDDLIGRMKGIQGHRNSCYIDATLYAMFVQSTAFDHLLERQVRNSDIPQYKELIRLLSTEIVYPLRKFHYVRADHVMKIRELFAELMPNVKGLTSEEKDPEEILGQLFNDILRAEPFVKLLTKEMKIDHMFLCPMVVEDWRGGVATTQHLLERHMKAACLRFAEVPKTLILQLPRYGQTKVFDKILPLERIDITGLVHNGIQPCYSCGKPAEGMCPECFLCKLVFLTEVSFCGKCFKLNHCNWGESDHVMKRFYECARPVKRTSSHKMVLSAVLCIETSHYVAYVRSVTGKWLFFDSMADREGLSDGFNVPQVKECDKMSWWLSQSGWERMRDADMSGSTKVIFGRGGDVDPLVSRLLSDSYICFYHEEQTPTPSPSSSFLTNMVQRMKM